VNLFVQNVQTLPIFSDNYLTENYQHSHKRDLQPRIIENNLTMICKHSYRLVSRIAFSSPNISTSLFCLPVNPDASPAEKKKRISTSCTIYKQLYRTIIALSVVWQWLDKHVSVAMGKQQSKTLLETDFFIQSIARLYSGSRLDRTLSQ
jgi:hypothetical protein